MILDDHNGILSPSMFPLEFGRHMREKTGYSVGYQDSYIAAYSAMMDMPETMVANVYWGIEEPTEAILADMGIEKVTESYYFYRAKSVE